METSMDHTGELAAVHVVVSGGRGKASCVLQEGESVLVGSAAGCQLRIEDENLPKHQCLVELRAGTLLLHNWGADSSITLNGQPIDGEAAMAVDDLVEFGGYQMVFGGGPMREVSDRGVANSSDGDREVRQDPTFCQWVAETVEADELAFASTPRCDSPLPSEPESVEAATIKLLNFEIGLLQRELDDRDATIAEMRAADPQKDLANDAEQGATICSRRVEDLLIELQLNDDRVSNLEHELRILEDVRAAELEEKQQIESWVSEIEKRIARREAEAEAEMDALTARLERERAARLASQTQADANLCAGSDADPVNDAFRVLRRDHESLREKYHQLLDRNSYLEKHVEELAAANTPEAVQERVHEAVRLERLQLAQERAAISRREHEIANRLKELEAQVNNEGRVHEADARFHAFRERLKELHLEERAEYRPPSIGQRLLKMWNSLDGPTDVD